MGTRTALSPIFRAAIGKPALATTQIYTLCGKSRSKFFKIVFVAPTEKDRWRAL